MRRRVRDGIGRSCLAASHIVLSLALVTGCASDSSDTSGSVTAALITPADARGYAAARGAQLGAAEAAHTGALIGRSFELRTAQATAPAEVEAAARGFIEDGAVAIIGGFDDGSCGALARLAAQERVLFLNIGCAADAGRRAPPATTFHIEASESLYDAAGADSGDVVLWHEGLTRYGAAQLNDRFLRQTNASADGPAWAGWMAVKVLWESVLETDDTDAAALATYLSSDRAAFDGHKGEPLRFDSSTHQLLQPLYDASSITLARGGSAGDTVPTVLTPLTGSSYAFVSNEGSGDVTVIDLATHRVVSRIPVGGRPRGIRVSPDRRTVMVALSDDAPLAESDRDAIAAIDLASGAVTARHDAGSDPEQFAISPDGRMLYSANEDAGTASLTDVQSGEVLATLVVGIEPEGVAVSPDGRWVYVTAESSNTVSVIDTRSRTIAASFLVDSRPRGVTFSPTAPRAYVTNEISGTLSVVDTETHRVIATVRLDDGRAKPVGVAVSPDGRRVYVANGHANTVSVINAADNRVLASVPVGRRPWGIAVSPDGSRIYTANGGSSDVSVIDAAALRVVHTISVGARPWGVAIPR